MKISANVTGTEMLAGDSVLKFEAARLSGRSFAGRNLVQFVSIGSSFHDCDFRHMTIAQAVFGGGHSDSLYSGCVFDGARIAARSPGCAVFEGCSFLNVSISELNCRNVEFVDCIFSGEINKGYFNGKTSDEVKTILGRTKNRFSNNDFSGAQLGDVGFRSGIDLSAQILPRGDEYIFCVSAVEALAHAKRLELESAGTARESLSLLIKLIERDIRTGQNQLFYNSAAFPSGLRSALGLLRQIC